MAKRTAWISAILAFLIAVSAGRWGKGLFTTSEFVHFSVNFPVNDTDETLTLAQVGGPWTRLSPGEWNGYPKGGVLVWGQEDKVTVDLGSQGWIKELVQPRSVLISTHWLRNVGAVPYNISLALDMCGFETRWITFERLWNPSTKRFERPIAPGKTANMDWEITVPDDRYHDATICKGTLTVSDTSDGRTLTRLPIDLVNTGGGRS